MPAPCLTHLGLLGDVHNIELRESHLLPCCTAREGWLFKERLQLQSACRIVQHVVAFRGPCKSTTGLFYNRIPCLIQSELIAEIVYDMALSFLPVSSC